MRKLYYLFAVFFIFLLSLSFVSSNFVCGIVNNSKEFSSSWVNVIIYTETNSSKFINCKINPESKFCCDLEELYKSILPVGSSISAEVFDEKSGFVAGPVSLTLTGEGYDLFPQMDLQKTIVINSPGERIFINQSSIIINVSLAEKYNSLNYSINSSEYLFKDKVCTNCNNIAFPVNLSKGKNEITLTAYGNRNISEKIIIYNLDYLNFKMNISCNKCKLRGKAFYVPSGENISFYSYFNASHDISGDFLFYFPLDWGIFNSSDIKDFSLTHNILSTSINDKKELLVNYTLQSPKVFIRKDYTFYQKIENEESLINVSVSRLRLIPFYNPEHIEMSYFNQSLLQKGSPDEPIILNSRENNLKLVAIFPTIDIPKSYSGLKFDMKGYNRKNEYSFALLTTIAESDIDRIFLVFQVEKGKSIELYLNENNIPLEFYDEDSYYNYYSAYVHQKGPFRVKVF